MTINFISKTRVRQLFAEAMSDMYQSEIPKYKLLLEIVGNINKDIASSKPEALQQLGLTLNRVIDERHGAIRLGSFDELVGIAKIFTVMGMSPCNYYDLTVAGHPIHSTAFRPTDRKELADNPFRVFCSVLRQDLLPNTIREEAISIIKNRKIFSEKALELAEQSEEKGGLSESEAKEFVKEATKTFKWHKKANISIELYEKLKSFSPIAADIVAFKGPHINHLTPICLDIDKSFSEMKNHGLQTIDNIQGPPKREVPILLRQTSFKAIEEETSFPDSKGNQVLGKHRARFGEIECRGIALTKKGRELYDELLMKVIKESKANEDKPYVDFLNDIFSVFPKTLSELRKEKLAYFYYEVTDTGRNAVKDNLNIPKDINELINLKFIDFTGIIYEDFLPVSAAGIFDSNLSKDVNRIELDFKDMNEYREYEQKMKSKFENGLKRKTIDTFKMYEDEEKESITECYKILGL